MGMAQEDRFRPFADIRHTLLWMVTCHVLGFESFPPPKEPEIPTSPGKLAARCGLSFRFALRNPILKNGQLGGIAQSRFLESFSLFMAKLAHTHWEQY